MKSKPNRNLDAAARNKLYRGAQAGAYLQKAKQQKPFDDARGKRGGKKGDSR